LGLLHFLEGITMYERVSSRCWTGHIAGYDGSNRVSDFVQHDFWPGPIYEREKPNYVVYRR
jgi:hypothetical protein